MFVKFKKLTFKNILSYGSVPTEITFDKGLILVTAGIGMGKSAILDALSYCLYGKPYRKIKIAELMNWRNRKNLETSCEFEVADSVYRLTRNLKPDALKLEKDDGSGFKDITLLSTKMLNQDEIDKILGVNYQLFKQIICLAVCYNKPFLTLESAEKRDIIESIFNLKIFGQMLKVVKKNITTLKIEIESAEKIVSVLETTLQTSKKHLDEVKEAEKQFNITKQSEIAEITSSIEKLKENIEIITKQIAEYNEKIKELGDIKDVDLAIIEQLKITKLNINQQIVDISKSKQEKDKLLKDLEEKQGFIIASSERIADCNNLIKDINVKDLKNIRAELASLEKEHAILESQKEEYNEKQKRSIDLDKQIKDAENLYLGVSTEIETLVGECGEYGNFQNLLKDITQNHAKDTSELQEVTRTILNFKDEQKSLNLNKCPTCKREISEEYRVERNEKIEGQLKDLVYLQTVLQNRIETYIQIIQQLTTDIKNIEKKQGTIEVCKEKQRGYKNALVKLVEMKDSLKIDSNFNVDIKIDELYDKIEKMKDEIFENEIEEKTFIKLNGMIQVEENKLSIYSENINSLKGKLVTLEQLSDINIEGLQNKISQISEKIIAAEQENETIQKKLKEKQKILTDINASQAQINFNNQELNNYSSRLTQVQDKKFYINIKELQKNFEVESEKYLDHFEIYEQKQNKLKYSRIVADILSEEGIKSYFFKKLIPVLNQKINEYLNIFDLPIRLTFNEKMEESIIGVNSLGKEVNYYNFSGGQRTKIDISIQFAFISIMKDICNWDCSIKFIDEMFDSQMDDDSLTLVLEKVRKMVLESKNYNWYIISHKSADKERYFDKILKIEQENGFSKVRS